MPNIFDYTDHRQFLRDAYKAKKARDKSFSHRYICNKLDVKSVAVFRHLVTGRNKISDRQLSLINAIFGLNKKEAEYFDLMVHFNQATKPEERRDRLSELSGFLRINKHLIKPQQYAFYEEWYHSAIRACLSYYDFSGDHTELASLFREPITAVQARNSLRLLESLGMVKQDAAGFPRPADRLITTGDQASSVALNTFLIQMLDLARSAVDKVPREQREMSSITLSLSQKTLEKVRTEIAKCRYRVFELVRNDRKPDRVYQASFQLFPLTSEKNKHQ